MHKIWIFILVGVVIVLVGISAFLYGQNINLSQNGAAKTENNQAIVPTGNLENNKAPVVSPTSAPTPVVVIESEGSIPAQDLSELKLRVINPYIDFKAESQPGELVSFKVSPNLLASKDTYPYMADAVFKNGGNEGFLIMKSAGHINWYLPECINGCNFSESFKAKYPEIVK